MSAYYNEHDPFAAQWLKNLIAAGHIAPGDVDERDLWDVKPYELEGYTQVHLCAGVGIWSLCLRRSGWSDRRPVWTGSFPCQPFSAAGKRLGVADERHLWPAGYHLIRERKPDVFLGEQVASKDGLAWLEGVQVDLEAAGYAVGAVDTCAAGFASEQGDEGFHIRQRLYYGAIRLGDSDDAGSQGRRLSWDSAGQRFTRPSSVVSGLGHSESDGRSGRPHDGDSGRRQCASGQAGAVDGVDDAASDGREQRGPEPRRRSAEPRRGDVCRVAKPQSQQQHGTGYARRGRREPTNGSRTNGLANPNGGDVGAERQQRSGEHRLVAPNSGVDWLYCRDGKYRPVESGTLPLAHADTARVGRLRSYGNALDAAQAEGFIEAFMSCVP